MIIRKRLVYGSVNGMKTHLTASWLLITLVMVQCGTSSPTAPTPTASAAVPVVVAPAPLPSVQRFTVAGVVSDALTRQPIGGATVSTLSAPNAVTDGNGYYSMAGVLAGLVSLAVTAPRYNGTIISGISVNGDTRRDVTLAPFWTRSGKGNTVFDMPATVMRVRIHGTWDRTSNSNFIVRVAGRLVLNEILRETITYDGVHLLPGGGVTEIISSSAISWVFSQES